MPVSGRGLALPCTHPRVPPARAWGQELLTWHHSNRSSQENRPAMGGSGLWPHLRTNAAAGNEDGRRAIATEGKRVGIEANGLIFRVMRTRLKDKSKAKGVVDHTRSGSDLPDPELLVQIARDVVAGDDDG